MCWGASRQESSPLEAPSGPFVAISAGWFHTCGLRPHGRIDCWGDDTYGESSPPDGVFIAVSAGRGHTCGLRVGGLISCWGTNSSSSPMRGFDDEESAGQAGPPDGVFAAVAAGSEHTCGIRSDGRVECWGDNHFGQSSPPDGHFVSIGASLSYTCGLRSNGAASCWGGENNSPRSDRRMPPPPTGEFIALSVGLGACGIRPNGDSICWDTSDDPPGIVRVHNRTHAPVGQFTSVSAGNHHTCAIRISGSVTCWSEGYWGNRHGQATPPEGEFVAIDAGRFSTCGIRVEGDAVCWGRLSANWQGDRRSASGSPSGLKPPSGVFASVSVGGSFACGLRPGGRIDCWGHDDYGQSSPPEGSFGALSAGGRHACGLRVGGEVACWGDNSFGQTASPEGAFSAVSAGEAHTCGLRSNGDVACWGHTADPDHIRENYVDPPQDPGRVEPPEGTFSALSAGSFHTCGIRPGGDAECWPSWGVEGDLDYRVTFPVVSAFAERGALNVPLSNPLAPVGNSPGRASSAAGATVTHSAGAALTCGPDSRRERGCWAHGSASFTALRNALWVETPQGAPGAPRTGTPDACDADRGGDAECSPSWDARDYGWTPVDSPVSLPAVWKDSRVEPLPGPFVSLSTGWIHSCGIRPDNTIDCWSGHKPRN